MKLVHRVKITTRVYIYFIMACTLTPSISVAATKVYDAIFLDELKRIRTELNNTDRSFTKIEGDLVKLLSQTQSYNTVIEKVEKAVIADVQSNIDWVNKNKLNAAYQTQLEKLKNDLNVAENLSDAALAATEANFFTSSAALKNMSKVYGKNNQDYERLLFDKKPLCPSASANASTVVNAPGIPNATYTELQETSCQTVHNVVAYKEQVNNILADKDKIIDDATNNALNSIIKLPSKTIGDHNARQTALETVRLLRKVAINDNDIRLHNSETEIEIAQHIRKYAANSVLTGPPKNPAAQVAANIVKLSVGAAIGVLTTAVAPYNQ